MNSRLERGAILVGLLVLLASLQFCLGIAGDIAALLGAAIFGTLGAFLWTHFDLPQERLWIPPAALAATILSSTVVVELGFHRSFLQWFAPLPALAASAATIALRVRNRARCNLCNRRLTFQSVTFRCPRCTMLVCDETCWSFEHRRCQMCLENRVPILPIADSWWNRVAGPRSAQGRCQICLTNADQADLRACAKCRRLQCRSCWDFNNGECSRCAAILSELPGSLRMVVAEAGGQRHPSPRA